MPLIQRSILIDAPSRAVYSFFRDFSGYPELCESVQEVRETGPHHAAWTTGEGEWETAVSEEQPGRRFVVERAEPPARATVTINPVNGSASWVVVTLEIPLEPGEAKTDARLWLIGRSLGLMLRRGRDRLEEKLADGESEFPARK